MEYNKILFGVVLIVCYASLFANKCNKKLGTYLNLKCHDLSGIGNDLIEYYLDRNLYLYVNKEHNTRIATCLVCL